MIFFNIYTLECTSLKKLPLFIHFGKTALIKSQSSRQNRQLISFKISFSWILRIIQIILKELFLIILIFIITEFNFGILVWKIGKSQWNINISIRNTWRAGKEQSYFIHTMYHMMKARILKRLKVNFYMLHSLC